MRRLAAFSAPRRISAAFFSAFTDAQAAVKSLPSEPSDADKLKLYALFKQATAGPNAAPKPGMFDFVGGAKWAAWKELGGMSAAEAEKAYVALAGRLAGGSGGGAAPAPAPAHPPLALPGGSGVVYRAPLDASRGVEAVVLNAPPVNALSSAVLGELAAALRGAAGDPSVRAVVLASASAPGVFSGGLDIAEMAGAGEAEFSRFWGAVQDVFLTLYPLRKPVAAAVEGAAPAGGCWLALQCDHRVLLDEPRASIGLNEVRGRRAPKPIGGRASPLTPPHSALTPPRPAPRPPGGAGHRRAALVFGAAGGRRGRARVRVHAAAGHAAAARARACAGRGGRAGAAGRGAARRGRGRSALRRHARRGEGRVKAADARCAGGAHHWHARAAR